MALPFLPPVAPPPTLAEYAARAAHPNRLSGGRRTAGGAPDRPRVSVVTVARNAASTIEDTLRSVLSQEVAGVEHVIVDGGSTDGTLDILRRYEDRLALWISEPDKGISDAFNKGLALARGDVIGILNADDWYAPGALAASLAALDQHPEAGFTFGHLSLVDESGRPSHVMKGDAHYAARIGRRMPQLNHPTVFVRRPVYEQVGLFRPEWRIAMDYDFLLRAHRAGVQGVLVPQVITHMRTGGVSSTFILRAYKETLRVALANGQPPAVALSEFCVSAAGHYAKRALLRAHADGLVQRLERWRYPTRDNLSG